MKRKSSLSYKDLKMNTCLNIKLAESSLLFANVVSGSSLS